MIDSEEYVVLVNESDEPVGTMGKLEAHRVGALHRAFSVFLFDNKGRLLMQQRAAGKYHGGGLWTNTCCGHPRPGEQVADAARRRLSEEMGVDVALQHRFTFRYKAQVENELVEHEVDHVLFGRFDGVPDPDPSEVQDWSFADAPELQRGLTRRPERFTVWLRECWPAIMEHIEQDRNG